MIKRKRKGLYGDRTLDQIRQHYEVEKSIATRLKQATFEERRIIYQSMYDELFQQVPDHPRLKRRKDPKSTAIMIQNKLKLVENFIDKNTVLVEFGPGDCSFAIYLSNLVKHVYGVDISEQSEDILKHSKDFELIIYDGSSLEIKKNSVDVVFSDQLIEHLHPDDIELHFNMVKGLLKQNGVYIFRSPHRFSGPHDVSRYFSDEAEGFHLKEWTYNEILNILKKTKYSSWQCYWYPKYMIKRLPITYFVVMEKVFISMPKRLIRYPSKVLLPSITMVVKK